MPAGFSIGVLAAGTVVVLAALLGGRIFGAAVPTRLAGLARAGCALAGAVLLIWGAMAQLRSAARPAEAHAVVAVPPATPAIPAATAPDLVHAASAALNACALMDAPSAPDGATASTAQMAAARGAFQRYDTATNAYVECVDSTIERIARQFAGAASQENVQTLRRFGVAAHNAAIDHEQAAADRLNLQVRAYNARHAKSARAP